MIQFNTQFDFSQRRALVCGASQGIGEATAQLLAQGGAEVVLVARNVEKLQDVASRLPRSHGQKHIVLSLDFADPSKLQAGLLLIKAPLISLLIMPAAPSLALCLRPLMKSLFKAFKPIS
jgi:short-subunit dehydrogenase